MTKKSLSQQFVRFVHAQIAKPKNNIANGSLASKGFLRFKKPYVPDKNVGSIIEGICKNLSAHTVHNKPFKNAEEKFAILSECSKQFDHNVPNSQLYEIKTLGDIIQFYKQTVDVKTPYDALTVAPDLPPNLHIQKDYVRFQPDETFFGKTVFPKSSTIVTGLKYREKYKGHTAKRSWP